ncbi:hypothetical protein PQQ81_26945 [Paraburkholderia strydomiana]|uniref:hypothetical protein n=1 Tax=Paraburkholderia strydomiana TaxID=1245417 RepID=UPI0038B7803A
MKQDRKLPPEMAVDLSRLQHARDVLTALSSSARRYAVTHRPTRPPMWKRALLQITASAPRVAKLIDGGQHE